MAIESVKTPQKRSYVNVTLRISPELHTKLIHEAAEQSKARDNIVSINALLAELCDIGLSALSKQRRREFCKLLKYCEPAHFSIYPTATLCIHPLSMT